MILTIDLKPILSSPKTYLSGAVSAGVTTIDGLNTTGFTVNDFITVGVLGEENTEIKAVTAITDIDTLAVSALLFKHPSSTLVQEVLFDQIKLEKSVDNGLNWTSITTINIPGDVEYYDYLISGAVSTDLYRTRFYNSSSAQYSEWANSVSATGDTIGLLVNDVIRKLKAEGDNLIQTEDIFEALSDIDMEIAMEIMRTNPSYYQASASINLVANTEEYALPNTVVQATRVLVSYDGISTPVESIRVPKTFGNNRESWSGSTAHYIYQNSAAGLLYIGLLNIPITSIPAGLTVEYIKQPQRIIVPSDSLNTPNSKMYIHVLKWGVMSVLYRHFKADGATADILDVKFKDGLRDLVSIVNDNDYSEPVQEISGALYNIYNAYN